MDIVEAKWTIENILKVWRPDNAVEQAEYEAMEVAVKQMDYRIKHKPIVVETFDSFTGTTLKEYRCPGCKKPISGNYEICPICGQFIKVME